MTAPDKIDVYISELGDWRGEAMSRLRAVINGADPRLGEDWKWGTPVWTFKGNVCAIGAFKTHVKVNFFKGARLPQTLFNAGLDAKESRSIDLAQGESVDKAALAELVRAAADLNA